MLGNFSCFLSSADFFKIYFLNKFFQEHYQRVNSLDPDRSVGPDIGPNCLQNILADDKIAA